MSRHMIAMNAVRVPGLQIVILAAGFSSRLRQPKALARISFPELIAGNSRVGGAVFAGEDHRVAPPRAARYKIEAPGVQGNLRRQSPPRRGPVEFRAARHRNGSLLPSAAAVAGRSGHSAITRHSAAHLALARRSAMRRRETHRRPCRDAARRRAPILPHRFYAGALAVKGDIGLRDWVNELPPQQRVLVDLPSAELDVDTPEDLHAARRGRRGLLPAAELSR